MLTEILRRLVLRSETHVIYAYSQKAQGKGRIDSEVVAYDADSPPPPHVASQLFGGGPLPLFDILRFRMRRRKASVFCLIDGQTLAAYGWIQTWGPFERKYRFLADRAVMLGPYWTAPQRRGEGMYGRLLAHSIAVCTDRQSVPPLIFTSPENLPSQRGIEKAGFAKLGVYQINTYCLGLLATHRTIEQIRRLEDVRTE